ISGNTAEGYQNILASNVESIRQKIFLKHPSRTLKTLIFNRIIDAYKSSFNIEVLCSSWSKQFVEGIIIRGRSMAIIDNTLDTGEFSDAVHISVMEKENGANNGVDALLAMEEQLNDLAEKAYKRFETALTIHDDLEAIYIQEMDFGRADELIDRFIVEQVKDIPMENESTHVYHRMFGTNTADGVVNVASELMNPISKRYILKGRAGTGKSVFMKRVAKACEQRGLDVELYHCSFDPSSIDMVLVRDYFCVMDGTAPHEFEPERVSDAIR